MRILFLDCEEWEAKKIREYAEKYNLKVEINYSDLASYKGDVSDVQILSIFINSKVNKEQLKRMPSLKLIVTRSTGFDHIDLDACKKRNIHVCNIPDYGSNTVAEFTFLLILALVRRFRRIENFIRREVEMDASKLRGFDLAGKTIGIIGAGRIGSYVAKLAHAFEMKLLYYDLRKNEAIDKLGGRKVSLEYLLSNSDIITLHLPLNDKTYHIINKENIKLIKDDAFLVNTARGGLVETEALVKALRNGKIAGVALDVFEGEEVIKYGADIIKHKADYEELRNALLTHVLVGFENVIITPHIAYNTFEALTRIVERTFDTIRNYMEGRELYNRII